MLNRRWALLKCATCKANQSEEIYSFFYHHFNHHQSSNSCMCPRGRTILSSICAVIRGLNLEALHWGWNLETGGENTIKASLISVLVAAVFIRSPCVMLNVSLGVADPQSNNVWLSAFQSTASWSEGVSIHSTCQSWISSNHKQLFRQSESERIKTQFQL